MTPMQPPEDCPNDFNIENLNINTETLPPRVGEDCDGDPTVEKGNPVTPVGVTTVKDCESVERNTFMERTSAGATIQIPDGVISFSVTVVEGPQRNANLGDQPTIEGPSFGAPVELPRGFSFNDSMVARHNDKIKGPFDVVNKPGATPTTVIVSWTT